MMFRTSLFISTTLWLIATSAHADSDAKVVIIEPPTTAEPAPASVDAPPRIRIAAEFFGHGQDLFTDDGNGGQRSMDIDRAELGISLALNRPTADVPVGFELRLESIRSASAQSAVGIDGDSLVLRVKRAQVYASTKYQDWTLSGAAGLVRDPWIEFVERNDSLLPLSLSASEIGAAWNVSDIGVRATAGSHGLNATLAITTGEGVQFPERNNGVNTTGVVSAIENVGEWDGAPVELAVAAVARDGSVGEASARDHRFGGAASLVSSHLRVGVELIRALGLDGVGDVEAWVTGGWADVKLVGPLSVVGLARSQDFDGGDNQREFIGGLQYLLTETPSIGRVRVFGAVARDSSSGVPLPGVDAVNATRVMIVLAADGGMSW